jgi:hypothetical protein
MWSIFAGVFFILHGLVHLLYAGQARRFFELRPGLLWPDDAWLFSKLFANETTRWLAAVSLGLAALGFVASGLGLFFHQAWWRPAAIGTAVLSTAIFLLLWDGKPQGLPDKGWVGILINLVILAVVLILK